MSPNIPPPIIAPIISATGIPVFCAIPIPIGVSAVIVPTEVPIETEIKHAIINNPATSRLVGKIDKLKLTVDSTAPIDLATLLNAPAKRKMIHIRIILFSPAPLQKISSLVAILSLRFGKKATAAAIRKATSTGIL